jgi:hypothetical protein
VTTRAQRVATRSRYPAELRLLALTQEIRDIARGATIPDGTRSRLHAIAHGIDRIGDELTGKDKPQPRMRWATKE